MPTRERARRYILHEPGVPKGGPGPDYVAYVVVFLSSSSVYRLYEITLSAQAQVTHQLRASLSDILQRFVADPVLLGGGGGGENTHSI